MRDRFRASYLTVWNVGQYGIYVEGGEHGTVDHDYVSGAADAAYYVGECAHCDATISHVVAALSAVGYSGTNASELVIRDSMWDRNGAGIVPNTYANEAHAPQRRATIVRNTVTGSGRARVPISTPLAGFIGIGIAVAGGNENVVRGNRVTASERYGIAVFPTARRIVFAPRRRTTPARRGGRAETACREQRRLGQRSRRSRARERRRRRQLLLARTRRRRACLAISTDRLYVAAGRCSASPSELTAGVRKMFDATLRRRRPPEYTAMPRPPAQPNMP